MLRRYELWKHVCQTQIWGHYGNKVVGREFIDVWKCKRGGGSKGCRMKVYQAFGARALWFRRPYQLDGQTALNFRLEAVNLLTSTDGVAMFWPGLETRNNSEWCTTSEFLLLTISMSTNCSKGHLRKCILPTTNCGYEISLYISRAPSS